MPAAFQLPPPCCLLCMQDVAERVAREAARRHFAPRVLPADAYLPTVARLPAEPALVWVASTTGQGDPPDNMRQLWRFLLRKSLAPGSLGGLRAAVFGLGDSGCGGWEGCRCFPGTWYEMQAAPGASLPCCYWVTHAGWRRYPKFNITAKKLFRRLEALGAHMLLPVRQRLLRHPVPVTCLDRLSSCLPLTSPLPALPRLLLQVGLGDDQHRSGYEAALDPWLAQLWPALRAAFPLPAGLSEPAPTDTATQLVCKYRVVWLSGEEAAAAQRAAVQANVVADGGSCAWAAHAEALSAAAQFDGVEAAASGLPPVLQQQSSEGQPSARAAGDPATTAGHSACDGAGAAGYGPHRPYWARLAANERITAPIHFQDVSESGRGGHSYFVACVSSGLAVNGCCHC